MTDRYVEGRLRHPGGSILLTVMVVISIMSVLVLTLLSLSSVRLQRSARYGSLVQARWLAEGEAEHLLARIGSGLEALEEKEYSIETELGAIEVRLSRSDDPREYVLSASATVSRIVARVERGIFAFYPSDYAVSTAGSWAIRSRTITGAMSGRIYVGGDLLLAAEKDGSFSIAQDAGSREPTITITGDLDVLSLGPESTVVLIRTGVDPYNIARPWPASKGSAAYLLLDGAPRYQKGGFADVYEAPLRQRVDFPEFRFMYSQFLEKSDVSFRFMGADNGQFGKREILNPKLLQKDFLAVGNGTLHMFRYTPSDRPVPQIYMRRTRQGQLVDDIVFDPIADADAVGNRFFTARMGMLHLPGPNTRMYLQMDESAFKVMGRFYFGTSESSYCAIDNPLTKFTINTAGEDSKYQEGKDFFVNPREKYIEFSSQEFYSEHYAILPERGDGYRLGFGLPERTRPKYVYVNGLMDSGFIIEEDTLFFDIPPPDRAEIAYMIREPRVFAQKNPPPAGVSIFTDKLLEVMEINLGTMRHYPGNGFIVTDKPVVVTGTARFPVSIVSTQDIYMDNINANVRDPKPVGLFSGGNVWVDNNSMQTNVNMRVYVHSEGQRIYTTASEAKVSRSGAGSAASYVGFIVGSVHLGGRSRNGFDGYPRSMLDPGVVMYSDEDFFTVQYRHDPAFDRPENLPPGVSPRVKILWWKR